MSRIGNAPITIPEVVEINISDANWPTFCLSIPDIYISVGLVHLTYKSSGIASFISWLYPNCKVNIPSPTDAL